MEYVFSRKDHKWVNLTNSMIFPDESVERFDPKTNKKRIKLKNRYPGLNFGKGYTYLDPKDVLFIWKDGTLFGQQICAGCTSHFNIKPEFIVNKEKTRKMIDDAPGNVMKYVLVYVDILMRSPEFWSISTPYYRKVNRDKVQEYLNKNVISKLTEDQLVVYELESNRITDLIDKYEGNYEDLAILGSAI